MSIALPNRASVASIVPWTVLALGLLLIALNFALHDSLFHRGSIASQAAETAGEAAAPARATLPETITLTEQKLVAAKLAMGTVTSEQMSVELGVPGRIEANLDREVQIRPRASGVIRAVNVVLGQKVKAGDVLAVLDSADVGTARLNLRARQRELATARIESDWKKQIAENVAALIPLLRKRAESAVIEKQFSNRPLGAFRSTLLAAYAKFDIAAHEEEKTAGLRRELIVGEHPVYVTKHTREGAQAEFEGVVEQTRFDANQQSLISAQMVRSAEAAVVDAAERLRILGVPEDLQAALDQASEASIARPRDTDLTGYQITAPFDGTILTKTAVPSQKAEVSDVLCTLADLSTVWVMANIPESDFGVLSSLQQGPIQVTATAYPSKTFQAKVLSIGATVDATTRTVPMLAETKNDDELLKLGMFVRIALDTAAEVKGLTVPTSALVEIDGATGVFVPEGAEGRTFRFKPVKVGHASGGRSAVTSGLSEGLPVVSQGAFLLKSELILQNEGDDE